MGTSRATRLNARSAGCAIENGQDAHVPDRGHRPHRKQEVRRQDTDHASLDRLERRQLANDVRSSTELVQPDAVSEDHDRLGSRVGVGARESAADERLHAKRVEEIVADGALAQPGGIAAAEQQRRELEVVVRDVAQRPRSRCPLIDRRHGHRSRGHERRRITVRQRFEQDAVDDAEYG